MSLLMIFDKMLEFGQKKYEMLYLDDRDRNMIHMHLDKVQVTHDPRYVPILEAWVEIDYKKVRQQEHNVIKHLKQNICNYIRILMQSGGSYTHQCPTLFHILKSMDCFYFSNYL
jgi:hypothetical protein